MTGTRVAAIQMSSTADVDENLESIARLVGQAADAGAELVCLPENCVLMPLRPADLVETAANRAADIDARLGDIAGQNEVFLVAGSVPAPSDDANRILASCRTFDQSGQLRVTYDKIHLFDVSVSDTESYSESDYTVHGSRIEYAETPAGRLGLTICYDMRFPELYRQLALKDVSFFSVPSAFTVPTGRAHWEILLRARAIENLAYVLAPAQVGTHPSGRETYGHSMIIDPWGGIMNSLENGEGVVLADIDPALIANRRKSFPALEHRRIS